MELKTIIYSFASAKYLKKRAERNGRILEIESDVNRRMKLIDDEFYLLKALIRKNRRNKDNLDYMKRQVNNFVLSYSEH